MIGRVPCYVARNVSKAHLPRLFVKRRALGLQLCGFEGLYPYKLSLHLAVVKTNGRYSRAGYIELAALAVQNVGCVLLWTYTLHIMSRRQCGLYTTPSKNGPTEWKPRESHPSKKMFSLILKVRRGPVVLPCIVKKSQFRDTVLGEVQRFRSRILNLFLYCLNRFMKVVE